MKESKAHHKINVAGVKISSLGMQDLLLLLNDHIINNIKTRVCITPVNCLTAAHKSEELKHIYNTADFVLCDGVPVLWASKLLGTPIKERITGLDFTPIYIEEAYLRGYSMYFLGAKEGVAEALAHKMQQQFPAIKILGYYSPPFADKFSEEENKKMRDQINALKPDILWVSFTAPKQDYWIYAQMDQLDVKIAVGVGGAFEVTAGLIDRAPLFFQKNGLEWLYRFMKEPKRLFRRYFIEAPIFIPLVIKQRLKRKENFPKTN